MLAHFIHRKGKGGLVIALPFIIGFVLFILLGNTEKDDLYIRDFSLIISGVVLFIIDNKKVSEAEGVIRKSGKRIRGVHQLMWVDMKYWAVFMGILGMALFIYDINVLRSFKS